MMIRRWGIVAASLWLAGCAQVVSTTAEEVRVDTGALGEIAPGARVWLGWFHANAQCAAHGRKPKLADLKGALAIYRCVEDE